MAIHGDSYLNSSWNYKRPSVVSNVLQKVISSLGKCAVYILWGLTSIRCPVGLCYTLSDWPRSLTVAALWQQQEERLLTSGLSALFNSPVDADFWQNAPGTVTETPFSTISFQKAFLDCKGFLHLLVLSNIKRLGQFSVLRESTIDAKRGSGTAWPHHTSCYCFLSNISLLCLWPKTKQTKMDIDYFCRDGGKGLILLSLKCFCHYSNVFSVTETYLECFSPL